jgi:hypothetical protein
METKARCVNIEHKLKCKITGENNGDNGRERCDDRSIKIDKIQ